MLVYVMYVYFMESNPCTCLWVFVYWYWYCFDFSPFRFSSFTKLMAYSYRFIPIFFQPSFLWFILLSLFIQCPLFHLHTCYTFHPFLYFASFVFINFPLPLYVQFIALLSICLHFLYRQLPSSHFHLHLFQSSKVTARIVSWADAILSALLVIIGSPFSWGEMKRKS